MANWMQPFPDSCRTDPFGIHTEARKKAGLGPHRGTDWGNGVKGKSIPAVTSGKIELAGLKVDISICFVSKSNKWSVEYSECEPHKWNHSTLLNNRHIGFANKLDKFKYTIRCNEFEQRCVLPSNHERIWTIFDTSCCETIRI